MLTAWTRFFWLQPLAERLHETCKVKDLDYFKPVSLAGLSQKEIFIL